MNELADALKANILSRLKTERRAVLVEYFWLTASFSVAAVVLTLATWWVFKFVVLYFFGRPRRSSLEPMFSLERIDLVAWGIFAFFILVGIKKIFQPGVDSRGLLWGSINPIQSDELGAELVVIGPRCSALAFQCALFFLRVWKADLEKLCAPLEVALRRRGRIHELRNMEMSTFLSEAGWIPGVVRLLRGAPGFILTDEFRAHFKVIPEERMEGESIPTEPDSPDEEIRWALSVLGLDQNATRKEISVAYRRLAKLIHPDVRGGNAPDTQMKDLNLAYEILRHSR